MPPKAALFGAGSEPRVTRKRANVAASSANQVAAVRPRTNPPVSSSAGTDPGIVLDGLMATMGRYKEMSGIVGKDDVGMPIRSSNELSQKSLKGHAVRFYNIGRALCEVQKVMFDIYRDTFVAREAFIGTSKFESCVHNFDVLKAEVEQLERQLLNSLEAGNLDMVFAPTIRKKIYRESTFECIFDGLSPANSQYRRTVRNLAALCVDNDTVYKEMNEILEHHINRIVDADQTSSKTQYAYMKLALETPADDDDDGRRLKEYLLPPPQLTLWRFMFGYAFPIFTATITAPDAVSLKDSEFAKTVSLYDSSTVSVSFERSEKWLGDYIDLWEFTGSLADRSARVYTVQESDFSFTDSDSGTSKREGLFIPISMSENVYERLPSANGRPTDAILENGELEGGDDYGASWQRDVFEKRVHQWEDHVYRLVMKIAGYCNIEQQTLLSMDLSVQEKEALVDMRQKLRAAETAFTADMDIIKSIMNHVVDNSDVTMGADGTSGLSVRSHSVVSNAVRDATAELLDRQTALGIDANTRATMRNFAMEGGLARQIQNQISKTENVTMESLSSWAEKKMKDASEKLDTSMRRIRADKNSRTPSWAMSAEMGGFVEFSPKLYWAVSELPMWIKRCGFDGPDAQMIENIIRQNETAKSSFGSDIEEKHTLLSAMIGTIVNFREQKNPRNYVSATQQANVLESRLLMQIQALMYTWTSKEVIPNEPIHNLLYNGQNKLYSNVQARLADHNNSRLR